MAFRGNFEYQMDERNRVALPPRFREPFSSGAVLTPGPDGCIEVYTPTGYEAEARLVEKVPAHTDMGRKLRRAFFGSAFDVAQDAQGRLLLPAKLTTYASIEKDVVVVGMEHRLEIWARAAWESQEEGLQDARASALESVAERESARGEEVG